MELRLNQETEIRERRLERDLSRRLRKVATRNLDDYRSRCPGTYFGQSGWRLTIDEAYAVQIEMARLRVQAGDHVAGFKVGCVGPNIRQQFGLEGPISGVLFKSEFHSSGAEISVSDYANLSIEGEIAVNLDDRLAASSMMAIIELHNYVLRARPHRLEELVANNGLNAGLVMAPRMRFQQMVGPRESLVIRVVVDGSKVQEERLDADQIVTDRLRWLFGHMNELGLVVQPGDLVLTGTQLNLLPVASGQHVRVEASGLDACTVFVRA